MENAAQWQVLIDSEHQKRGQNEALEFVETPAPPAVGIASAFTLWLLLRRKLRSGRRPMLELQPQG